MNIFQQERAERRQWGMASLITTICAAVMLSLALSSCATFEKARRRFATDVVDTTFTTVTTTIPRDSVHLVVKTDTTRIIERMRQGRATVTIIREPTNTTVIANCDSLTKSQKVATRIVTQKWGVDPAFKEKAQFWQTLALAVIGLLVVGILVYVFTYRLRLSIQKR